MRLGTGIRRAAIAIVLWAIPFAAVPAGPDLLVSYSLDDRQVAPGPDTFSVFEKARGRVDLSSTFRFSGYRSVRIRDTAGDGDFPELQGHFPLRRSGDLYAHFAFLTTDPMEAFNVALAGPHWFSLKRDGIGFWLEAKDGLLFHHSNGIAKRLLPLRAFTWYVVDLRYSLDEGSYGLTIHEEGVDEPIVALENQRNAPALPGSAVDKLSFIGDRGEDTSNVVYFIDDVALSAGAPIDLTPPMDRGRRKTYIDAWLEFERMMLSRPGCLPAVDLRDLGIGEREAAALKQEHASSPLETLTRTPGLRLARDPALNEDSARLLEAAAAWGRGCGHLENGRPRRALGEFERAARMAPRGRMYHLSIVQALALLKRWNDVDARLGALRADWEADPRFPVAMALIGVGRESTGDAASPERQFFVLLWRREYRPAETLALRMADRHGETTPEGARWLGRAGETADLRGDHATALRRYERALRTLREDPLLWSRMADIHFRLGDVATERLCREKIFAGLMNGRPD